MVQKDREVEDSLKLIARTSLIILVAIFFSKIFTYIYRVVIARNFGPEVYGLYSLAFMIISFIIIIASLGLGEGLNRYIPFYRGKNDLAKVKSIIIFSSKLLIVTGFFLLILTFIGSNYISLYVFENLDLALFLKIFALAIPFSLLSNVLYSSIKGFEFVSWYSLLVNVVENAAKLLIISILILIGFKELSVPISYVGGAIILFVSSILVYYSKVYPKIKGKKLSVNKNTMNKELLNYSWPLVFSIIFLYLFYYIDSFLIGIILNVEQVGIYNAAVPLSALLIVFADLFTQLFMPLINKEYALGNKEKIKELSKQVNKWIFMFNLPILIVILFFPDIILNLFFGDKFLGAANTLRFLAIGVFFSSIFYIVPNKILMMKGQSKVIFSYTLIASILDIILNIVLIPKYGINGAAAATLIVWLLLCALISFKAWKLTGIFPLRRKMLVVLISIIPATIVLSILIKYLENNLFNIALSVISFCLIYTMTILLTGALDRYDIKIINSYLGKIKPN